MRLTLGKKLALGFGVIIAMMAFSTVVAFYKLKELDQSVQTAVDRSFPSALMCQKLVSELNQSISALRGYIILGKDPQDAEVFRTSRRNAWRAIDESMTRLTDISREWEQTEDRRRLSEIAVHLADLRQGADQVEQWAHTEQHGDAIALMEAKTVPVGRMVRELAVELIESMNQRIADHRAAIEANAHTVTAMLLGGTLIAMALAGIVGVILSRRIVSGVQAVAETARRVAGGDLTAGSLTIRSQDEVGDLATAFNTMCGGLRDMADQIRQATENVNSSAAEILASTQQQAAAAKEQAGTIQEITSTLEEINQSGGQIGDRAKQVSATVEAASSATQRGMKATQGTSQTIESIRDQVEEVAENVVSLSERTQTIGEIIATVSEISEQSNLLALNASIEAASAGDQGSRFSVVAHEMKNLADRAKECTMQVRTILGEIQKGINTSVMLTEEAVKRADAGKQQAHSTESTIREVTQTNDESIQAFQQIVAGTNQQQIGVTQVTQGMQDIRQAIKQTAASTSQMEKAAANMNALSQQLQRVVSRYRV